MSNEMSEERKNLYAEYEQWLKETWNITPEENEKNLVRLANGEFLQISMHLNAADVYEFRVYNCDKTLNHARFIDYGHCEACERGLRGLHGINIFGPATHRVETYVVAAEALPAIHRAEIEIDAEIATEKEKERQETERKAAEEKAERGNRTVVKVTESFVDGLWTIIGGENGRLPKEVWKQAMHEMKEGYRIGGNGQKGKYYALLTEHFAFYRTHTIQTMKTNKKSSHLFFWVR
ncbi:MAG: hypothetical protein QW314_01365 [Thermoproteota archaeon]